jgi:hypothetical protein
MPPCVVDGRKSLATKSHAHAHAHAAVRVVWLSLSTHAVVDGPVQHEFAHHHATTNAACRNNNAGGVAQRRLRGDLPAPQRTRAGNSTAALGAIAEDEDDNEGAGSDEEAGAASVDDVPQAFSHFTWGCTDGQKLVCDLQVCLRVCVGSEIVGVRW